MIDLFNRKNLARVTLERNTARMLYSEAEKQLKAVRAEIAALKKDESDRRAKLSENGKKGRAKQLGKVA